MRNAKIDASDALARRSVGVMASGNARGAAGEDCMAGVEAQILHYQPAEARRAQGHNMTRQYA